MNAWKVLANAAGSQFGLIALWQAAELGVTRQDLARRTDRVGWTRVLRGVYLLPGHGLHPLAQIKAVELALHCMGAGSHRAAEFVWGLTSNLTRPIEFLVRPDCSRRPRGAWIRESQALLTMPTTLRRGITVISAPWTICTLGSVRDVTHLKKRVALVHRMRLATPATIWETLELIGPSKGRQNVVRALLKYQPNVFIRQVREALAARRASIDRTTPPRG
jgi:hypothetical protein